MTRHLCLFLSCASLVVTAACDCGGTPPGTGDGGSDDASGADAASGNQPPVVTPHATVALYPGASAPLLIEPMHDAEGDALTCAWSASPTMTGIELPTGCVDPEIAVDRRSYQDGPADQTFTLTLNVSDGVNARDLTIQVTVLDERGGDVSNSSAWEGVGYTEGGARHGFCGAPGRACKSIEDAMLNLRDRIHAGDVVEPLLRLATTGTNYQRDEVLLLDDDAADSGVALSLECGFDPVTWDKVSGNWTHTPIRFRSAVGVEITASNVRLEGCDIQGAEPLQVEATRTAVHVTDAATEIVDNILVGAPETLQSPPEVALGLDVEIADDSSQLLIVVENNDIRGGFGNQGAAAVQISNGLARVTGNRLLGGRGDYVTGLWLKLREGGSERSEVAANLQIEGGAGVTMSFGLVLPRGDIWIHDNPMIAGCSAACSSAWNMGLMLAGDCNFSLPLLERNHVHGVVGRFDTPIAIALNNACSCISRDNTYRGGRAGFALGAMLRGALQSEGDSFEGGEGVDLDPGSDDDGAAYGLQIRSGSAEVMAGMLRGSTAGTSGSLVSTGALVAEGGDLRLEDSRVESGSATSLAVGIDASATSNHLVLAGTTVAGGNTGSGAGSTSVGLLFSTGVLSWTDSSATAGHAASSSGLILVDNGDIHIDGGEVRGGDCSSATDFSRGIWMRGESSLTALNGLTVRAGDGCRTSVGLLFGGTMHSLQLRDSDVAGGAASLMSAGVFGSDPCPFCRFERNAIAGGGSVEEATPLSVGLRLTADGNLAQLSSSTFVVANRIRGGSATISHGLNIAGDAGDDVVVLHNIIDGGGLVATAGAISGAVVLAGDPANANARAGVFVGNVVNAGVSETSYGFFESCNMTGGLHRAEPFLAANSAFWPAIDGNGADPTGYVRKASVIDCAGSTDLTTLADVNAAVQYGSNNAGRASLAADPQFEADGIHLQASSPLKDASLQSDTYWPFDTANPAEPMLDVDGVARPCGVEYDIGVDEICP